MVVFRSLLGLVPFADYETAQGSKAVKMQYLVEISSHYKSRTV